MHSRLLGARYQTPLAVCCSVQPVTVQPATSSTHSTRNCDIVSTRCYILLFFYRNLLHVTLASAPGLWDRRELYGRDLDVFAVYSVLMLHLSKRCFTYQGPGRPAVPFVGSRAGRGGMGQLVTVATALHRTVSVAQRVLQHAQAVYSDGQFDCRGGDAWGLVFEESMTAAGVDVSRLQAHSTPTGISLLVTPYTNNDSMVRMCDQTDTSFVRQLPILCVNPL